MNVLCHIERAPRHVGVGLGVRVVLVGGNGVAGIAAATTAGDAAIVPAAVAQPNPAYEAAAGPTTGVVWASMVVTAILCSILAALCARRITRRLPEAPLADQTKETRT